MSAPESLDSLCHHLRRMADKSSEQIDADRLSRAAELLTLKKHTDDMERAVRSALDAAAGAVSLATADQRCLKCGHPRGNHPYRHPFVATSIADPATAMRALDPAAIVASVKRGEDT